MIYTETQQTTRVVELSHEEVETALIEYLREKLDFSFRDHEFTLHCDRSVSAEVRVTDTVSEGQVEI